MVIYDLPANPTSIRLNVEESGWCSLQVVDDKEKIDIFGDLIDVVRDRRRKAILDPSAVAPCGELNGAPIGWVAGFSEAQVTLYLSYGRERDVTLFVQDGNLNVIGTVTLSAQDRENWCRRHAASVSRAIHNFSVREVLSRFSRELTVNSPDYRAVEPLENVHLFFVRCGTCGPSSQRLALR